MCSISGCDRPTAARGWCRAHYMRWRRDGDVRADVAVRAVEWGRPELCTVDGCDRPHSALGMCKTHYQQDYQRRDPAAAHARSRRHYLRSLYGLGETDYAALLERQGGGCGACEVSAEMVGRRYLLVDHDHATGAVRGLLCPKCNTIAGFIEHQDVERVKRYLEC